MEKVAVLELNVNTLNLWFAFVQPNKSFNIYNKVTMPIDLFKDFNKDEIIKPVVSKEIISILSVYKKMIDAEGITEVMAFATPLVYDAKNHIGFIEEIFSATSFRFEILSDEDRCYNTYLSVINTFNKPKALIINVADNCTDLILYNRRNILNTYKIPFGKVNLAMQFANCSAEEKCSEMKKVVSDSLKDLTWTSEIEDEYEVIGTNETFLNLGRISRRAKRYAIDVEHNYELSVEDFNKVYDVIKPIDTTKNSKIKGVSVSETPYLQSGFSIISAVLDVINKEKLAISKYNYINGKLFQYALPITTEKPISDNLGYSLQILNEYYDRKPNNAEQVYNLSMILFKQLKVLHKLSRSYVRVLRIASYMSACEERVNIDSYNKISFNMILNSDIYGVSHTELVLAAFVSMLRNIDNFNLSEWVRYKDLVLEEDVENIKKLAVILNIAESLDITKFGNIIDISCDILGDSVIMKTISENDVAMEIKHAMQNRTDFKKAFNKNLEIL